MAITFGASGASSGGTTSMTLAYPAGVTPGQLLVAYMTTKYPANPPTTPDGWTLAGQATGGSGASGADAGSVLVTVFYKVSAVESGNLSVTITGGNSAIGMVSRYTHTGGNWSIAATTGSVNTASVSWSVTGAADPGITGNDMVLVCSGINTDLHTYASEAIIATGATFGTAVERVDTTTFLGDQVGIWVSEHPVSAGTATAAPVYTTTISGSATANEPAGASVIVRLREVPGLPNNYQFVKVGDGMSASERIR